ncbi:MAG: cbb3-type cytochrome c oxidase subunit 3 [Phycisphaerales bacterium]|nr:cbb3-type cytochrome c oxidase subunit 3 [Phycisphaerales bacterium]
MSMSKIMSFLELSVYPSIALVFFLAAFIAVIWRVMTTTKKDIDDAANIVLDDDTVVAPRHTIKQNSADEGGSHV